MKWSKIPRDHYIIEHKHKNLINIKSIDIHCAQDLYDNLFNNTFKIHFKIVCPGRSFMKVCMPNVECEGGILKIGQFEQLGPMRLLLKN